MPCFDPRASEDNEHNNEAASILCELLRLYEDKNLIDRLPKHMQTWWLSHKKRDEG